MEIKKHLEKLGIKAEDKVTGIEGIITSISFDLYGCVQVILTTQVNKENGKSRSEWYDIARIKVTGKKPVIKQPNFEYGEVAKGNKGGFKKPIKY